MNKLYDVGCYRCGEVYEKWLSDEQVADINDNLVYHDGCKEGELYIVLGTPQFHLKGDGWFSPGKS